MSSFLTSIEGFTMYNMVELKDSCAYSLKCCLVMVDSFLFPCTFNELVIYSTSSLPLLMFSKSYE